MSELPEGVASAMFLRDGWPRAIVCKVLMRNGCVGIGLVRYPFKTPSPEAADAAALADALRNIGAEPPDYSELHDHVERMKAESIGASNG